MISGCPVVPDGPSARRKVVMSEVEQLRILNYNPLIWACPSDAQIGNL